MKDGLKEINQLVGVWGSLICDNQGKVIQAETPPGLNKASQENVNRHILDLFISSSESVEGLSEAVLYYSERKIFLLDLEKAILVVFCTPSVDISLLRMTVNLVLANWEDDSKVQKIFQNNRVDRVL